MRIIMIGPPGAGKGTQAQYIVNRYGIPQISTGNMLRNIIKNSSGISRKTKDLIGAGKLVNDSMIVAMVKKRINHKEYHNGFLLDGFPRTICQYKAMQEYDINIDYVFEFDVPDSLIIDRIAGRRVHEASNRVYHIKFNPPIIDNLDDITGEPLIIRHDDNEKIVRKRLIEYHQQTSSLIKYWRKELNTSSTTRYITINGTSNIGEIRDQIVSVLG